MESTFNTLEDVLNKDEKLVWRSRPGFARYFLCQGDLWFGGAFNSLFISIWFIIEWVNPDKLFSWKLYPLFLFLSIVMLLVFLVIRFIQYQGVAYGLTEKRAFFRGGFLSTSLESLDLKKVRKVEVRANLIQMILRVGSIRFFTGQLRTDSSGVVSEHYECWESISNPRAVMKKVEAFRLKG
jgi:uncharacterized membrane protein YdbT with pleckstrin-like domain